MNEIEVVKEFAYETLRADATLAGLLTRPRPGTETDVLNLYRDRALTNATYPLVIVRQLTASDVNALPVTARIQTELMLLVEAYGDQPNTLLLRPVADRLDSVLIGAGGDVDGLHVHGFYRERPTFGEEVDGAKTYYRLGGEYRTTVSRAE